MNSLIQTMTNRASVRSYIAGKEIPADHMEQILKATQQSPTYINGQQYSVIAVTDEGIKDKLLELTMPSSGNPQQWVKDCSTFLIFVMDFSKHEKIAQKEGATLEITNYFESLLIGTVDVGIGMEAATVAAEALGYGTVSIGAVRRNTAELIKLLDLPKMTFPIVGLCIGHKASSKPVTTRPRLPLSTFVYYNKYEERDWTTILEQYNEDILTFATSLGQAPYRWTQFVSGFYGKSYWEELSSVYRSQGFDLK